MVTKELWIVFGRGISCTAMFGEIRMLLAETVCGGRLLTPKFFVSWPKVEGAGLLGRVRDLNFRTLHFGSTRATNCLHF